MNRHVASAARRPLLLLLAVGLALGTLSAGLLRAEPTTDKKPMPAFAEKPAASDAFARALFAELMSRDGNLTLSPASIESSILLALAGARGQTAAEMAAALRLSDEQARDIGPLLDRAAARAGSKAGDLSDNAGGLTIANSAWVQQGFPIHEAYRKLLEGRARATFETVDFAGQTEAARRAINDWVEEATRNKIVELLGSGSLDRSTRLVLANAIYFKGKWQTPFDKQLTREQPFRRPGQPDMPVPLMYLDGRFRYLETDTYQAIELPYADSPHAMVVWLPKAMDGLPALERELAGGAAVAGLDKLAAKPVQVFLPKFKVSGRLSLEDVLAAMGMKDAFTPDADFGGITEEPLWISAVVHQALVEVDEQGTEAAAATAVVAVTTAAVVGQEPKVFRADHPFVFAIRDTASGDLLFVGRVETPEK